MNIYIQIFEKASFISFQLYVGEETGQLEALPLTTETHKCQVKCTQEIENNSYEHIKRGNTVI